MQKTRSIFHVLLSGTIILLTVALLTACGKKPVSTASSSSSIGTSTSSSAIVPKESKAQPVPSSTSPSSTVTSQTEEAPQETESGASSPSPLHPNYEAILATYRKWMTVLRQGGSFDDPTVEEGYLKYILPTTTLYYSLYDINADGSDELILASGEEHKFIFSIWGNESYPTRLISAEVPRRYVDLFPNGLVSTFFLDGFRPESEGEIYRIEAGGQATYLVGTFLLNPHTDQVLSQGTESLPDRSTTIQDQLQWQVLI